jgi:two-component system NtrC family sensor kinase
MKKSHTLYQTIIPDALKSSIDLGLKRRSYHQFRIILFSIMIIIAMGPVIMVAVLSYNNYDNLIQKEEREQLEWTLDGSIKSIEQMIESLKSVVQFAARRDRYTELTTDDNLEELCVRMKRQYPFFDDLGVIDQDGIQQAYFGPYNLKGVDYAKEPWLKDVFDSGVYISQVYTGYRRVPHFAIAVSNLDPNTKKMWVLRATIDAVTLQQFVNTIKTNASDDLFLVDEEGMLQTSSKFYGKTLSHFEEGVVTGVHNSLSSAGENYFHAIGPIAHTPWSLVLLKKRYIHNTDWKLFRRNLYLIVCGCTIISILVVYTLVNLLTSLISKADEVQLAMLKDAEHTDKLASIGRLAAGVGHEINNPLAIIDQKTGLIEDLLLMTDDFEHKKTIEGCLKVVNQSVDRCKAITHRLLGFARRTDVQATDLQINDVIKEDLQFLENAMLYNRIKLDLQLQEDLPHLKSDRLQLQQIFLNIINNAIDAIGKNGKISILSHLVAGEVRIIIQDDGPGIPDDILPHIFEPFYTTKETGKGTGLGLSITYGLTKKLGGDITVRSHVGRGTAFTITLPLENQNND